MQVSNVILNSVQSKLGEEDSAGTLVMKTGDPTDIEGHSWPGLTRVPLAHRQVGPVTHRCEQELHSLWTVNRTLVLEVKENISHYCTVIRLQLSMVSHLK